MSALITFTAQDYNTKTTFKASANLDDNAPLNVRDFLEELETVENGEIIFNEGDNLTYDSVADFVQTNPAWFRFYDENGNDITQNDKFDDFTILSYF